MLPDTLMLVLVLASTIYLAYDKVFPFISYQLLGLEPPKTAKDYENKYLQDKLELEKTTLRNQIQLLEHTIQVQQNKISSLEERYLELIAKLLE